MPHTDIEEGIYTIANAKAPNLVLDADDGKALVNQFMGCESQLACPIVKNLAWINPSYILLQWEISKLLDFASSIRNLSTGHYLGMNPDDKAKDWYEIGEVDHPFPWHFRRGNPNSRISVGVPYTNHVIDTTTRNPKAGSGTVLFTQGNVEMPNQQWYFCKDLHLAASEVLRHDSVYRIVNAQSNTAIQMSQGKGACFTLDEEKDCQKFTAVETDNGWAFRNNEGQDFLGLPNMGVSFGNAPRLSSVKKKFTWVVVPHHEDTSKFKIWIPFTSRVMDLHIGSLNDDAPIHMHPERDVDCQWWRFELIDAAHPASDAQIEDSTGAPEPLS
ncbi:hypothetical protein BKA70DRAFT_1575903 [Coprinopsis sp. MPI-PUGE-AT-0042]|nr:hypothetical protein BKA70DRAFT_1575903 [Coprinopsis sp. MPI-PUGE-AT-0042]